MPRYGYKCECGNTFATYQTISDRNHAQCSCGQTAERDIPTECALTGTAGLIDKDSCAGFWEHISYEGVHVSNRRELRDTLKRSGKYAPGVFDSGN